MSYPAVIFGYRFGVRSDDDSDMVSIKLFFERPGIWRSTEREIYRRSKVVVVGVARARKEMSSYVLGAIKKLVHAMIRSTLNETITALRLLIRTCCGFFRERFVFGLGFLLSFCIILSNYRNAILALPFLSVIRCLQRKSPISVSCNFIIFRALSLVYSTPSYCADYTEGGSCVSQRRFRQLGSFVPGCASATS